MLKALIVDDSQNNRDTLEGLLRIHFPSMTVEAAADGKETMGKVGSFQPDLIIMDIRLPDESGLELTKKIKNLTPNVRVLILTGHHNPEYREAAAQYGADGFLIKGGASKEILEVVESFFPKAQESIIVKNQ
jgi:DNA-binding NarL/FixJ family response regulator